MSTIEKAVAQIYERKMSGDTANTQRPIPRRERLILSGKANPRQTQNRKGVNRRPANFFKLPYKELEVEGVVELSGQRNQLSEEYRAIKRNILSAIDDISRIGGGQHNVVMVTSSVPGEGKTYSAINLAFSIAMEKDRSVLLVDGDITNPSCGQRLGFRPTQPGLTDVLLDTGVNVNDVICQSDNPNLRFLPAGIPAKHATELLSSRDMKFMIEKLSESYRDQVIVFDSAPMLMTSEASVVADLAGQIIFVVSAETTTHGMVSDSLKMIRNHSRVGFVLNKTRKKQSNIYGYGYGYGQNTRQ